MANETQPEQATGNDLLVATVQCAVDMENGVFYPDAKQDLFIMSDELLHRAVNQATR